MKISSIEFFSKPRNQSEIVISWETGETTNLIFNSAYPLMIKEVYENAIRELFNKKDSLQSYNELFGLFSFWFARNNLIMPLSVATFTNDDRKRIGERIKSIRESQNMEAKQLAIITGIDAANISRIEQGKYSVGLDSLSRIANALGYKLNLTKMNPTQLKFGSIYDSNTSIKEQCESKAAELSKNLEISIGEEINIPFWTEDFPELICVAKFQKNEFGDILYMFDYSLSTLI